MDLKLTEEQSMLRDSLRRMLADQSSVKVVREMEQDPLGYPAGLWQALADMGVTGLTLPEAYGGSALGCLDLALVYEEFGRALCPAPHLETAVICGSVIALGGSEVQKTEWLTRIAAGKAVLTPAFLEPEGSFTARGVQLRAVRDDDGYTLNGAKIFVSVAAAADRLLTLVRTGDGDEGIELLLVDPKAEGVTLTRTETHALDARYQVRFENVRVPLADRIGAEGSGWATWCAAGMDYLIAQSAWFVGCGDRALELATTYAKERVQFDRPIGSFQAIAHQLADSATGIAGARLLAWQAAWAKDAGKPYARLAATAHLRAAEASRFATRTGHQVFGGIGFTNDIDVQLYARRAKQHMVAWVDARTLEDLVARDLIDGESN